MEKKNNDAKKRARLFFEEKGISRFRAERTSGLSRGYLSTGGVMGSDKLAMIKKAYPDFDLDYVITGKKRKEGENKYKQLYEMLVMQLDSLCAMVSIGKESVQQVCNKENESP